MSLFRRYVVLISGIGTTVIFGAGAALLYYRLLSIARELERLGAAVAHLQTEFEKLRERLATSDSSSRRKLRDASFYSFPPSSGDDEEEIFLDAFSGSELDKRKDKAAELKDAAQKTENLFAQVDQLFEGDSSDHKEAYKIMMNAQARRPADVEFLWRMSKACYLMSRIEENLNHNSKKKEFLFMARDHAHAALKLSDENGNAHKWYAITLGSSGDYESTQNRIKNGFAIKKHIEKAIALCPADPSNHHMLGRWSYSVYMLSWIERNVAATLFASPPTASIDDALKEFLEAERLNPGKWKENMLYLGKSYIQKRDYSAAAEWLQKAQKLQIKSVEDQTHHDEIVQLLAKYCR